MRSLLGSKVPNGQDGEILVIQKTPERSWWNSPISEPKGKCRVTFPVSRSNASKPPLSTTQNCPLLSSPVDLTSFPAIVAGSSGLCAYRVDRPSQGQICRAL